MRHGIVDVYIDNKQKDLTIPEETIKSLVSEVMRCEGETCDEVNIHFVDVSEICRIHGEFFDDDSQTDCISFPMDDGEEAYRVLGDVFVCPATAISYVKEHGGDPLEETMLYVVHGLLHLLGYDDIQEEDKKEMREAEQRNMAFAKAQGVSFCLS